MTALRARSAALLLAAAGLAAAAGPARAEEQPRPVCARHEVLDVVADDLAGRGIGAAVLGSVGQTPTAQPDTVRCSVRVQRAVFDTNRFGSAPQPQWSVLDYTVRAGRNGLFVDVVGDLR